MADTLFNSFLADLASGAQDWDGSGVYRVALLGNSSVYTPDADNHVTWQDVLDNGGVEFVGTGSPGYSRQDLTGRAVTKVPGSHWVMLDADDVSFGNLNGDTVTGVVVLFRVGASDASGDKLVYVWDSVEAGLPVVANGGPISVTWNSNGLATNAFTAA